MFMRIEVEKSLRERIPYPDISFPFCVWVDIFNQFLDHTVNCHWHYDFEYGYFGKMFKKTYAMTPLQYRKIK